MRFPPIRIVWAMAFIALVALELAAMRAIAGFTSPDMTSMWLVMSVGLACQGVLTVLRSAKLGRIEDLDIRGISLDDEGAARVAASAGAARLKRLYLGRWYYQEANLGDAAALAVAASRRLRGLEQLRLDRMSLSEPTVAALRRAFGERLKIDG